MVSTCESYAFLFFFFIYIYIASARYTRAGIAQHLIIYSKTTKHPKRSESGIISK